MIEVCRCRQCCVRAADVLKELATSARARSNPTHSAQVSRPLVESLESSTQLGGVALVRFRREADVGVSLGRRRTDESFFVA